jgi:hypothetical protein
MIRLAGLFIRCCANSTKPSTGSSNPSSATHRSFSARSGRSNRPNTRMRCNVRSSGSAAGTRPDETNPRCAPRRPQGVVGDLLRDCAHRGDLNHTRALSRILPAPGSRGGEGGTTDRNPEPAFRGGAGRAGRHLPITASGSRRPASARRRGLTPACIQPDLSGHQAGPRTPRRPRRAGLHQRLPERNEL